MTFDTVGFEHFDEASRSVLDLLQSQYPMGLWMVTRTTDDDWTVLTASDRAYDVAEGTVLRWSDSFCARMVTGEGPRVAPRAADVPAYASAPIGQQLPIGAYVGVPLVNGDGELFGTLCAIDPDAHGDDLAGAQTTAEVMARLLGSVLAADQRAVAAARRAERALRDAVTDPLTGLVNRRGWDDAVAREEERARRLGQPVTVCIVDLNGLKVVNDRDGHAAGDALIARAAEVLGDAVGDAGLVARLGGDEFGVLVPDAAGTAARDVAVLARTALREAGIGAAVGYGVRSPGGTISAALAVADEAMYEDKRAAHAART